MVSDILAKQIVSLYREGHCFSKIAESLAFDRHKIPHILVQQGEPLRLPWQGTKAEWSKIYEKTPKGFLMRVYRNMQSRVAGIQHKKAHLYKGLSILPRNDFYAWAWDNADFWRLYKQWAATDFTDRRLTPSINRIVSTEGYSIDNIEWLSHSVNSSLGGSSPKRRSHASLLEVYKHVSA
jgi:hypothetical protein